MARLPRRWGWNVNRIELVKRGVSRPLGARTSCCRWWNCMRLPFQGGQPDLCMVCRRLPSDLEQVRLSAASDPSPHQVRVCAASHVRAELSCDLAQTWLWLKQAKSMHVNSCPEISGRHDGDKPLGHGSWSDCRPRLSSY